MLCKKALPVAMYLHSFVASGQHNHMLVPATAAVLAMRIAHKARTLSNAGATHLYACTVQIVNTGCGI